jgi:hypothetical protein
MIRGKNQIPVGKRFRVDFPTPPMVYVNIQGPVAVSVGG